MFRLPFITVLAATVLIAASQVATAESGAEADAKYKYPAYGQQAPGSQQAPPDKGYALAPAKAPANAPSPPAASEDDDQGPATDRAQDDEPAYRDDARRAPDAREDDFAGHDDGPPPQHPPPGQAGVEPPPRFGDRPSTAATASAPDRSIPYEVRAHDARRAAIEAWRSKVADRFGPAFSHWRMAAHRHVDCGPMRRDDVVCTVSGEPVQGYGRFERSNRYGRY